MQEFYLKMVVLIQKLIKLNLEGIWSENCYKIFKTKSAYLPIAIIVYAYLLWEKEKYSWIIKSCNKNKRFWFSWIFFFIQK